MNSIQINLNTVTNSRTISFIRSYNNSVAMNARMDAKNNVELQGIGRDNIPSQLNIVLCTCTFASAQTKQTFKRSVQRMFATIFVGYALNIKGNNCTVTKLAAGQTTDRGKVVEQSTVTRSKAEIEKDLAQMTVRAEVLVGEKEAAEKAAVAADRKEKEAVKKLTALEEKWAAEITAVKKENQLLKELAARLEKENAESVATVARLRDAILDAKVTRKQLLAMVG